MSQIISEKMKKLSAMLEYILVFIRKNLTLVQLPL